MMTNRMSGNGEAVARPTRLGGMELNDNFGQLTRIYFSNVLINPPLKQTLFQFEVPKGADVFEE